MTGISPLCVGNLFGSEDTEKIAQLKAEFIRAKETFDRCLQLQVFSDISDIGECIL